MRNIEEILAEQDTVIQNYPLLSELDSVSEVSFFSQMRKMWASLVQILEGEWGNFRAEIELKMASTQVGSLSWYVDQAKAFQFGDQVSILAGKVGYDVFDQEKQIIVQTAATEDLTNGRLSIKAARKGNEGLIPLSTSELDAFKTYVAKYKYAGTIADVISIEADQLKIVATVKVDRQVISMAGSLLSDSNKLPVHNAISAYLAAIPYDSVLSNTALTDALQAVKGVKDFTISSSFTRRPISSVWLAYNREVVSQAGHMQLHADSVITFTY